MWPPCPTRAQRPRTYRPQADRARPDGGTGVPDQVVRGLRHKGILQQLLLAARLRRFPPVRQWRHLKDIMIEAARRRAAATISGSWRSTRSALVAWGEFCGTFGFVHFPVERDNARMFAVFV